MAQPERPHAFAEHLSLIYLPAHPQRIRTGPMIVFLHRKMCLSASGSRRTTDPLPLLRSFQRLLLAAGAFLHNGRST